MKKVLILGANPETISLINKAKAMGLYTIVTDNNPDAYAKKFADQAENINAIDVDALEILARENNVDGILVGVAESLLPAYCQLCNRMNMPCYSTAEIFATMVRKDFFKNKCREFCVPTIREYTLEDNHIKYPVIVKPVDSCSSKGIRICNNKQELLDAVNYALSYSKSGKYIIEEYMNGDEVISYYVIQDGNPIFVGMCDRYTYKSTQELVQLPISYIFPSRYIKSYIDNTDEAVKNMIRGLGIQNGSIFFQCFADKEGIIRTYEPGFRLNGAQEHLIVSKVSGIDAKEMYINLSITGNVSIENLETKANPMHKQICCKLSPLVRTGKINLIKGLEEITELPDVVSVNPSYESGNVVEGLGTLKQIVCRFFIVSDNKENLSHTIQQIYQLLKVEDADGNNMLIGQFDTSIIADLY